MAQALTGAKARAIFSKPKGIGVPWEGEDLGHATVMRHPIARERTHPAENLKDAGMVRSQVTTENRLMMSNAVAESPKIVKGPVDIRAPHSSVWKRPEETGAPENHVVIRAGRARAGKSSTGPKKRDPESKCEGGHHMRWVNWIAFANQVALCIVNPGAGSGVELTIRIVVPIRAVNARQLPIDGIA